MDQEPSSNSDVPQQITANVEELHVKIKIMQLQILSLQNENKELKENMKKVYKEMDYLKAERNEFKDKVEKLHPTEGILNNPKKLALYTGLKSKELFHQILKVTAQDIKETNTLSKETQFLIVLMKLKLNLLTTDIAFRFDISRKTVLRTYKIWLPILSSKLQSFICWPSPKALVKYCPDYLKNTEYKNVKCIIDCTEFQMQCPSPQLAKSQAYSNYKSHYTAKVLMAIAPTGHISFISNSWGGRASDKKIAVSELMKHIKEGVMVLADRGFNLEEEFTAKGAFLHVPAYTRGKKQLSKEEVRYSCEVSNVRIHVERCIKQIKRFYILQHPIPITCMPFLDCVLVICAALCNMEPSIVK